MEIKFICMHIPTGQKFEKIGVFLSLQDFNEKINNWNRQGGQLWKYWEI